MGLHELVQLGFKVKLSLTMKMDNQAAIRQMDNEESSEQSKHIDIKLKLFKDCAKQAS